MSRNGIDPESLLRLVIERNFHAHVTQLRAATRRNHFRDHANIAVTPEPALKSANVSKARPPDFVGTDGSRRGSLGIH